MPEKFNKQFLTNFDNGFCTNSVTFISINYNVINLEVNPKSAIHDATQIAWQNAIRRLRNLKLKYGSNCI